MIRKLSCISAALLLLGCLMIGCSDDVSRITSPEEASSWDDVLSTSTDEPGVTFDWEEYISQGYYYPEDTSTDDYVYESWFDDSDSPLTGDVLSNKSRGTGNNSGI